MSEWTRKKGGSRGQEKGSGFERRLGMAKCLLRWSGSLGGYNSRLLAISGLFQSNQSNQV